MCSKIINKPIHLHSFEFTTATNSICTIKYECHCIRLKKKGIKASVIYYKEK